MRNLIFILIALSLYSCKKTDKEKINYLVQEWSNKEIFYPNTMNFTVLGNDTNLLLKSEYKIISYVDSIGCTSCKLRLVQWKEFIDQLDSIGDIPVLLFMHPKNRNELTYILKRDNFVYPICIDGNDSLNKLNHFPSDMMFQTFLLDKNDKVLAIGNPVHNSKVKELYLSIIEGNTIIKEKDSILTKIRIDKQAISLGDFSWQKEQKVVFSVKNIGNAPLVIQNINTSCGCTTVSYSKEPVPPGKEIALEVIYKAEHPEHFDKTISVYCNTEVSPIVLKISGDAK